MIKKNLGFIFLVSIFLSLNCLIKAMDDPNKKRKLDDVAEKLGDNEGSSSCLSELTQLMNEHLAFLKTLQQDKFAHFQVNELNISNYSKLLTVADKAGMDLRLTFNAVNSYFKKAIEIESNQYEGITFFDVTTILSVLLYIKQNKRSPTNPKLLVSFQKACNLILLSDDRYMLYNDLRYLLVHYGICRRLDSILDNIGIPFFMHMFVTANNYNAELCECLISFNKLKHDEYENLFGMRDKMGNTVLHHAVLSGSKDKLEVLLKLIQKQNLCVNDLICIQNNHGKTPLLIAANNGDFEIVNLLITYAKNIDLRKMINRQSVGSLKFLTTLAINKRKDRLKLISKLENQDLQKYCKDCDILVPKIEDHCAYLERMNKEAQEDLVEYKKLLYEILDKQYFDLNIILLELEDYFGTIGSINSGRSRFTSENFTNEILITLMDLPIMMQVLIRFIEGDIDFDVAKETMAPILSKIYVDWGWNPQFKHLKFLLAKHGFYLKLDSIIGERRDSIFMVLFNGTGIKRLFNCIMAQEEKEKYEWSKLFKMCDVNGNTVLHNVVCKSKNKLERLLMFMKNHLDGQSLDDYINMKNHEGITPLMNAITRNNSWFKNNDEILEKIELLIKYKADTSIRSDEGKTALDYAIVRFSEKAFQLSSCIKLLSVLK